MKGYTYFNKANGFSINEGQFPNIHVSWRPIGFYIAISERLKFHKFWN